MRGLYSHANKCDLFNAQAPMIYIAYEEYNGRAKTSVTSFPFITAAIEELYNRIEYE